EKELSPPYFPSSGQVILLHIVVAVSRMVISTQSRPAISVLLRNPPEMIPALGEFLHTFSFCGFLCCERQNNSSRESSRDSSRSSQLGR
ncbi:MAG TPA: hypothetical protein PK849_15195, partial [Synergistales bacterium]|nr:hypothetical protein [Synergistales bacterium]